MDTKTASILGACIVVAAFVIAINIRVGMTPAVSEVGRYQMVRSSGSSCFVLDTRTGRLWQRMIDPSGGPGEWSENKTPWTEPPGH
jgi:hypothetical protein